MTAPELKPCTIQGAIAALEEAFKVITGAQFVIKKFDNEKAAPVIEIMGKCKVMIEDALERLYDTRAPQPQSGDRAKALDALEFLRGKFYDALRTSNATLRGGIREYQNRHINEAIDKLAIIRAALTAPQWLPIETAPNEVWNFSPVDLWLVIKPSIQTMGFGDSFRVVDCYKKYGKGPWCHLHNGEEKEIKHELITHWMPLPAPPQTEKEVE